MTTMQIDRAVVEQALETIEDLTRDRLFTAEWAGKHGATVTALRAALAQQDEPVEPVSNEAMRLAGLALIGLAEHDQHCDVFDLDDQGRHKVCTCGLNDAIAVITQAGKSAPPQQDEAVAGRAFLERILAAMEGVIDVADRKTDEFDALRSCVIDLTLMLHTAPPQRKPLTEEEIMHIGITHQSLRQVVRAVERAHGIKE